MSSQRRVPAGIPGGGQFAAQTQTVSRVTLAGPVDRIGAQGADDDVDDNVEDDDRCSECGADASGGDDYDGLCGTCADRAEAQGRWG